MASRNPVRTAIAVVLIVMGAIWFLQGIGVIGGSFMTGATLWTLVGAACFIAGLVIFFRPGRPAPPRDDR
jgi:uncharacterized membrane protein HdeD (DUF308 family)